MMNDLQALLILTDKQIQDWLRRVHSQTDLRTLPTALSCAGDEVKACVFRNMSKQAKGMLNESIKEQSRRNPDEREIRSSISTLASILP
jgi:flagellar motor switch protein FliG